MQTLVFILFMLMLHTACMNSGESSSSPSVSVPPETTGETANSEQQGKAFSISTNAYYQANVHSSSTPGKIVSLSLSPEGNAELSTDFMDKSPEIVDSGEWTTLKNGNLLLNLRRKSTYDSIILEFQTDGDRLVYSGKEYGPDGLVLWVKPLPQSR